MARSLILIGINRRHNYGCALGLKYALNFCAQVLFKCFGLAERSESCARDAKIIHVGMRKVLDSGQDWNESMNFSKKYLTSDFMKMLSEFLSYYMKMDEHK